jgi:hypothetical protein
VTGFEDLEPRGTEREVLDRGAGGEGVVGGVEGVGDQVAGYGMDAVEGAGEDEEVIGAEFGEALVEFAVVDEATGFVDDEEGEDDPDSVLAWVNEYVSRSIYMAYGFDSCKDQGVED